MRFVDHGPDPDRQYTAGVALPDGKDLKVGPLYPNRAERIIRSVMHVAATVALILVSILMAMLLAGVAAVAHRLSDSGSDPAPAVTGCPFGDLECGG